MQPRSAMLLALWLSLGLATSAVEFKVDFVRQPASIRYNSFYEKYELTLELNITEVGHLSPNAVRVVTGMTVRTEKAIESTDFGATVLARVSSAGTRGQLVFVCRTWLRCANIKSKIDSRPSFIQRAVAFAPFGLQDGLPTQFGSVRSAERPAAAPSSLQYGKVVFQRHLDNSLSFAQNWDTYANGFGDPSSNFWMGLEQLSALTKDRKCKWIVKVGLFNGSVLTATYKDFQVLGAENYRLRVGAAEGASPIYNLQYHNNKDFSTFDRDNDEGSNSCSKENGGNAGWWFGGCHYFLPNAPIISKSDLSTKCSWDGGFSEVERSRPSATRTSDRLPLSDCKLQFCLMNSANST